MPNGQVGIPFRCPKCAVKHYYGTLKLRGGRPDPCPNCHTDLARAKSASPSGLHGPDQSKERVR
jgi:hypothetical protein